jgi:hypothetical protein
MDRCQFSEFSYGHRLAARVLGANSPEKVQWASQGRRHGKGLYRGHPKGDRSSELSTRQLVS